MPAPAAIPDSENITVPRFQTANIVPSRPSGRRARAHPYVRPVAALLALACAAAGSVAAHEFTSGALLVDHPYATPTPPGVTIAAGYLTITNEGDEDDRLLGGEAAFAEDVEMHETSVVDDVARMREKEEGILVEAGQSVVLELGGTHLMFTGLVAPLVDGERLDATLRFERAGDVPVVFAVERPGADAEPMDHEAMGHGAGTEAPPEGGDTGHDQANHGDMDHADTDGDGMEHGAADHGGTKDVGTTNDGMDHDVMDHAGTGHDG